MFGKKKQTAPDDEWRALLRRLHGFLDSLSSLAAPEKMGTPFGEGFGLEAAIALVPRHFSGMDQVRNAGHMLALDLLMGAGKMGFETDDLSEVMGATEQAFQTTTATPAQFKPVVSLAGAAYTFIGQLDEDGANMWDLWLRNDEVASEFLCWHALARLRLASCGKMEPLEMPS